MRVAVCDKHSRVRARLGDRGCQVSGVEIFGLHITRCEKVWFEDEVSDGWASNGVLTASVVSRILVMRFGDSVRYSLIRTREVSQMR